MVLIIVIESPNSSTNTSTVFDLVDLIQTASLLSLYTDVMGSAVLPQKIGELLQLVCTDEVHLLFT